MQNEPTDTQKFLVEFGKLLKKTRKSMGLSQVNASAEMRIDYRHYQNIEGGKINLRLDTMMKLIKFYNLDKIRDEIEVGTFSDLLSGKPQEDVRSDWEILYDYFVKGGKAGFGVCTQTTMINHMNDTLKEKVGIAGGGGVLEASNADLLDEQELVQLNHYLKQSCKNGGEAIEPVVVHLRHRDGARVPFLMVPDVRCSFDGEVAETQGIFIDASPLEEEGSRLSQLVKSYKKFSQASDMLKSS